MAAVYRPVSIRPFLLGPLIVLVLLSCVAWLLDLAGVVPRRILRSIPAQQDLGKELYTDSDSRLTTDNSAEGHGSTAREDFCAGALGCGGDSSGSECDANRRDFTLGYQGSPPPPDCPNRLSPQWTYWYFPNVRDRPCTDYQAVSASGIPPTADTPYSPPTAFENDFPPPAPSDCPYDPQGELYRPVSSDTLTIPHPF